MELKAFQVENFRSIDQSEWINIDDVTALIGTNESGKTNLLCALWKLNPVSDDGKINLLSDAPRKLYSQLRASDKSTIFIRCKFELNENEAHHISKLRKTPNEGLKFTTVCRKYNGGYTVDFPYEQASNLSSSIFQNLITSKIKIINNLQLLKSENEEKRDKYLTTFEAIDSEFQSPIVDKARLEKCISLLEDLFDEKAPKTSELTKVYNDTYEFISSHLSNVEKPTSEELQKSRDYIIEQLPNFVYYSNYGNLDSEIYLPHVIENLERTDLGAKESAKVKTLKVLFDYVKLEPKDILDLGRTESEADTEPYRVCRRLFYLS